MSCQPRLRTVPIPVQPTMQTSRVIQRFLEREAVHVAVPENTGLTFRRGPLTANVFIALMLLVWLAPTVVRFEDEDDILVRCQGPNCSLRSLDYEISGVFHGRCAAALGYSGGAQWQNCPWCPPAKQAENFDKPDDLSAAIDEHFEKFDNEAMIKMMIKSRTPTMRHVFKNPQSCS